MAEPEHEVGRDRRRRRPCRGCRRCRNSVLLMECWRGRWKGRRDYRRRALPARRPAPATVAATSWTRTMRAPRWTARTAATTLAASSRACSVGDRPAGAFAASPARRASVDLRDQPTRSGTPSASNASWRASSSRFWSGVLPKPMPGSTTMRSRSMPAACGRVDPLAQERGDLGGDVVVDAPRPASIAACRACASGRRRSRVRRDELDRARAFATRRCR